MQEKLTVTLTGFTINDGKTLPEEFVSYIIIDKHGYISAACWDTGTFFTENGEPGAFAQARMSSYRLDDVRAWLEIDNCKYDDFSGRVAADNELSVTIGDFVLNDGKNRPKNVTEYLLLWKDNSLTLGCWLDDYYPDAEDEMGIFKESRGGVLELEHVKAWAELDKKVL